MLDLLPFSSTWVLVGLCAVLLYMYLVWPYSTFKKLGIPGPKPLPLFGNYLEYKKGANIFHQKCYQKYNKVSGIFEGRQPMLFVGDLELVKEITVKEANSKFTNRRPIGGLGEILKNGLGQLKDADWKRVRSSITPALSSGKLKQMSVLVEKCADGLISSLAKNEKQGTMFDMKELSSCFSSDVISSTAFGVEVNSQTNPDHPLIVNAKAMFGFKLFNPLLIIAFLFPRLAEHLGISFLPQKSINFFSSTIDDVISLRKSDMDETKRVDFLQVMLKAHNEALDQKSSMKFNMVKHGVSMNEIKANAMIFWAAGNETTSSTLALTAYNLAVHPEAQDKAIQEIDAVIEKRGKLDYEAVHELPFMEMCINETMRIFPPAQAFDRVCKEDTEVKGLHIPAGMVVNVPVYAIHYDADIWPEPEKFKPERFSKEEKDARDPYAFLPFGSGPRNCVGQRLALLELKFALAKALEKFRFVICDKTEIPIRIKNTLRNQIEGGVWLKVEARA